MVRFNKLHSLIIAKVYNLPFLIQTYLKYDSDSFTHEDKTMSYDEIIGRFKVLTDNFPRDVGLNNEHFKRNFDDIPYPIIERALHTIIEDATSHCWKLNQINEQFIPFFQMMFDAFPELDFGSVMTVDIRDKYISGIASYFLNCSKKQSADKDFINDVDKRIDETINRLIKGYDGRYDNLPNEYARSMISKYIHIKVIGIAKRTPRFFGK